ncbi:MAG: hypothetical protein JO170_01100 [Verrucomicrobia bacterium]|nr:hypothetical protein [Verrucomicrobiota bacterium]
MHRELVIFATVVAVSCQVTQAREPEAAQAIQQLADGIVDKPPATYFSLATELYREGQKDEAAFWYYVGLIRFRVWVLSKGKDAESSDEGYHFSVLAQSVGQSIYAHADRDSANLIKAIDKALAWDLEQPNGYTSKDAFKAQYERARQELLALREKIKTAPASLKPERDVGRGMFSW